ncbi:MAG TPA: OB-fold domain-containing protein [Ramlibacter sp.]|nr:OB-fold domain-containing protein [Ramlibacter sp.]
MTTATRPLPVTDDPDTGEFFAAAASGRLAVRQCRECNNGIHPPTAHCPFCGSWKTEWRTASGKGTLYTWTTVHHQLHPGFPTPYTVVAVQLDDVPRVRLVGQIPGVPELKAGMPMEVFFESCDEGVTLPNWKPTSV